MDLLIFYFGLFLNFYYDHFERVTKCLHFILFCMGGLFGSDDCFLMVFEGLGCDRRIIGE